jgi:transposase
MGKPHPIELRERVVAFVNEGSSYREAARHFRVSPRFVNNMMILHRSSGSLAAAKQGHPPGAKLRPMVNGSASAWFPRVK